MMERYITAALIGTIASLIGYVIGYYTASKNKEEEIKIEYKSKNIETQAVLDQYKWERNIAIQQLYELGYGFGETVWKKFTPEAEDDLKDHYFYLVAHKDYKTPMKAKWHDEGIFQVLVGHNKEDEYVSIYDDGVITHYCKLLDLPKEEFAQPTFGWKVTGFKVKKKSEDKE